MIGGAPRIFALEGAIELEDVDEVLARIAWLAQQEAKVHQREDDVADVGCRANAPVVEHEPRRDAIPLEREVTTCFCQLATRDVPALGKSGLGEFQRLQHEQIRTLMEAWFSQADLVHDPVSEGQVGQRDSRVLVDGTARPRGKSAREKMQDGTRVHNLPRRPRPGVTLDAARATVPLDWDCRMKSTGVPIVPTLTSPALRMKDSGRPRIKICCIASHAEAELAIAAGADAIGLVSAMPSGPGPIDEVLIADIAAHTPPAIATFLLTCHQSARAIIGQHRRCRTNTIQIVDALTDGTYAELREALPGIALVQVIHVSGPASVAEAEAVAPHVNALLLDSGNPSLETKELGGTGRVHDWEISRRIRDVVDVPVFLAGGLRSDNVRSALVRVQPFGLDVCSGVRTAGALDPAKLAAFVAAAEGAAGAPSPWEPPGRSG